MGDVIEIGWSTATTDAIRAACSIAGHEPVATRKRRKPIVVKPIDYVREYPAKGTPKRHATAGASVIDLREARNRRKAVARSPEAAPLCEPSGKGVSSNSGSVSDTKHLQALGFDKWR